MTKPAVDALNPSGGFKKSKQAGPVIADVKLEE
jgi:hypothetical protein